MKIIVFDLWGDYAHFRVPYTTSSPLTFPIPTKTALYGIIGAFLGYHKDSYLEKFQNKRWKFAISIKKSISRTYISENFINTKVAKMFARMPKEKSSRTQINLEFLKFPRFRIYATSLDQEELDKLEQMLKEHKSIYNVVLGISECLANFEYIGSFDAMNKKSNDFIKINSIIPLNNDFEIKFDGGKRFLKIHLPTEMKPDRELIETKDFVLEANAGVIEAKVSEYTFIENIENLNENILLF